MNTVDLHPVTMVGGRHTDIIKNIRSPSLHELLSNGSRLLGFSFVTRPNANLCTELTTQNTTENTCIISQAKHASTSAQCISNRNVSITGHKEGRFGFPTVNKRQGQLQTPQSVSVSFQTRTMSTGVTQ